MASVNVTQGSTPIVEISPTTTPDIKVSNPDVGVIEVFANLVTYESTTIPDSVDGGQDGQVWTYRNAQGQWEFLTRVRGYGVNESGSTIPKYTPICINTVDWNTSSRSVASYVPADAAVSTKTPVVGVAIETAQTTGASRIMYPVGWGSMPIFATNDVDGLSNADISTYTPNQKLYLKAGGGFTPTPPSGDGDTVIVIGIVEDTHNNNGSWEMNFFVNPSVTGESKLPDLAEGKFFIGSTGDTVQSAYTLPTSDGNQNEYLKTDGSGAVTFNQIAYSEISGVPTMPDYNGALIIGGSSGPSINTLTAGTGISIGNADGNITITNTSTDTGDSHLANADLTLDANRTHDLSGNNLHFKDGADSILYLAPSSNYVGVNTASPGRPLHAEGAARFQRDDNQFARTHIEFHRPDENSADQLVTTIGTAVSTTITDAKGYRFYIGNNARGDSGSEIQNLAILENGDVEIKTATSESSSNTMGNARLKVVGETNDATKNALSINSADDSSLLLVRNDGNVGIGVTAPDQALHVSGQIKVDDGANPYVFPAADGQPNQVLATNGSGTLAFTTVPLADTHIGNTNLTVPSSTNRTLEMGVSSSLTFNFNNASLSGFIVSGGGSPAFAVYQDSGDHTIQARGGLDVFPSPADSSNGDASELRLHRTISSSGDYVSLKSPTATFSSSYSIVLPPGPPSANNKVLESDSSGNLSWIDTPTGGTVTVKDVDGSPTVGGVSVIQVTNGTLTNNGGGTVTIDTAGAVDISGTPTQGQLAQWVDADTIEGTSSTTAHQVTSAGGVSTAGDYGAGSLISGKLGANTGSLTAGHVYRIGSSAWSKTNADAEADAVGLIAMAVGTSAWNNMLLRGFVVVDGANALAGGSIGDPVYLSTVDGRVSVTPPTATNHISRVVGYLINTTGVIYFDPSQDWVKIS